jgi:hypothetical protein
MHHLLAPFKLLDILDLLPRVQSLGAGTGTIQYGMATIELKLIIDCVQALLGIFITAIHDPPACTSRITAEVSTFLLSW